MVTGNGSGTVESSEVAKSGHAAICNVKLQYLSLISTSHVTILQGGWKDARFGTTGQQD